VTTGIEFDRIEPRETIPANFSYSLWENPMGEAPKDALRLDIDGRLKLEFQRTKVISNAGLLAYRELDNYMCLQSSSIEGTNKKGAVETTALSSTRVSLLRSSTNSEGMV
jgi:hypothetical protein